MSFESELPVNITSAPCVTFEDLPYTLVGQETLALNMPVASPPSAITLFLDPEPL